MRLLRSNNRAELSLTTDLHDAEIPPYVILSHTWGADHDEVTFTDLQHGPDHYQDKIGYAKIQFCSEQAARDGIEHFWVDTCCIDKNNNSELSEAITSMYGWYRNAEKCYVYLSDVSESQASGASDRRSVWESKIRTSRWFTRGWTLQELLAPTVVEFYSRQGTFLGTKKMLAEEIHEITTIPLAALYGTPPTQFPVAERWRWAQGRQTKRKEDEAYCLLGIFEVFMPFNYGEGANAFRRLEEEVNKRIGQRKTTSSHANTDIQLPLRDRTWGAQSRSLGSPSLDQLPPHASSLYFLPAVDSYGGTSNTELYDIRETSGLPHLNRQLRNIGAGHSSHKADQLADFITDNGLTWEEYFNSLAFGQLHDRKGNVGKHTTGTCAWLLKSSEYEHWIRNNGLLLIRGHPGCGKSTLVKYALTERSDRGVQGRLSTLSISFFFYGGGTDLQKGTQGMFRSLLYQLLDADKESRPAFCELCREAFGERARTNDELKWSQHDLRAIFETLVVDCSARRITRIFIDAVDECMGQDREALIQFVHSLRNLNQGGVARIGILMTSRTYPDGPIVSDFEIRLEERNQNDIQQYIEKELRLPDETERSRTELKDLLQTRADGSFLWLVLVMQRIHELSRKGVNLSVIKSDVLRCPKQLDQLYEDLLGEIVDADISEAGILLQWMCFAVRPLLAEELRIALTIHLTGMKSSIEDYLSEDNTHYVSNRQKLRTRISYLSRGLVDFSNTAPIEGGMQVQFYHGSIKEFMVARGMEMVSCKIGGTHNLVKDADAQLANICLRFLSCKEVFTAMLAMDLDYLMKYAFFRYARDCWFLHAAKAEKSGMGNAVEWALRETLPAWICINQGTDKKIPSHVAEGSQPIHVAAQHGLISLAEKIFSENRNTNQGAMPTTETELERSLQALNLSPSLGSSTQVSTCDGRSSASMRGDHETNRRDGQGWLSERQISQQIYPVLNVRATKRGQRKPSKSPRLVLALQKTKVFWDQQKRRMEVIDVQNIEGSTPLLLAAGTGQLDMVALLCREGAYIRLQDKKNLTPLHAASSNGHVEVVKYLLEHGADIRTIAKSGCTPLCTASSSGHLEVVKYLLEYGIDIHIAAHDGWTPLCAASCGGHLEVVKYLHKNGADIHSTTYGGWTPLYTASSNGHLEVVKYLHKNGADIHTTTSGGWTPLCAASCGGYLEVVKYLHEYGADVNIIVDDGWTTLCTASYNGYLEVVKYLLEHGADIRTATNNVWTPLYLASRNGHLEVTKYLLEQGADTDIDTAANNGQTPLYVASRKGYIEVARYLLEYGANTSTATNDGWTPLCIASCNGHLEVVKCLLEQGADADIHTAADNGQTPLHAAVSNGHIEVIRHLLEHGADVNIRGCSGQTPLIYAVTLAQKAASSLLVDASADLTIMDHFGRTAIDWLKLLETDHELLQSICTHFENPPPTDVVRLQMSIKSASLEIIEKRTLATDVSFNQLGHYLLALNQTECALMAFYQDTSTSAVDRTIQHNVRCALCSASPIVGIRFVCKVCPSIDLCTPCMQYYQTRRVRACKGHEFMDVSTPDPACKEDDTVRSWLQENVDRYS